MCVCVCVCVLLANLAVLRPRTTYNTSNTVHYIVYKCQYMYPDTYTGLSNGLFLSLCVLDRCCCTPVHCSGSGSLCPAKSDQVNERGSADGWSPLLGLRGLTVTRRAERSPHTLLVLRLTLLCKRLFPCFTIFTFLLKYIVFYYLESLL